MIVIKNGILDHGTLKSAISQELIDEMSWFFACKLNANLIIIAWACFKMGETFRIMGP